MNGIVTVYRANWLRVPIADKWCLNSKVTIFRSQVLKGVNNYVFSQLFRRYSVYNHFENGDFLGNRRIRSIRISG